MNAVSHIEQGVASAALAFNPGLWLDAFTAIGGGYALTSNRKLAFLVSDCDADDLTVTMRQIVGQPERQEALKQAIEARAFGSG